MARFEKTIERKPELLGLEIKGVFTLMAFALFTLLIVVAWFGFFTIFASLLANMATYHFLSTKKKGKHGFFDEKFHPIICNNPSKG